MISSRLLMFLGGLYCRVYSRIKKTEDFTDSRAFYIIQYFLFFVYLKYLPSFLKLGDFFFFKKRGNPHAWNNTGLENSTRPLAMASGNFR